MIWYNRCRRILSVLNINTRPCKICFKPYIGVSRRSKLGKINVKLSHISNRKIFWMKLHTDKFQKSKFDTRSFSVLQISVHSIERHVEELRTMLLLKFSFDIIAISKFTLRKYDMMTLHPLPTLNWMATQLHIVVFQRLLKELFYSMSP